MRLGHFDPVGPLQLLNATEIVCNDYALELSTNGLVQSAALLKNHDATLPLSPGVQQTIAIIGPTANLSKSDVSYYGPRVPCGANYWTLIDAVQQHSMPGTSIVTTLGIPSPESADTSGIAAAVAMAAAADVVILAVGTDLDWAKEGHDTSSIDFTDAQAQLMSQVAAASKKPVTVITMTAMPLDLSAIMADPNVGAIMHLGQPSVTVLGAGELLFGKTSPAGRTVQVGQGDGTTAYHHDTHTATNSLACAVCPD